MRLPFHDLEKAGLRGGVVLRRAAQGFDEAEQGGQGGAQFVADIGDEIPADLAGLFQRRDVLETDHHPGVAVQVDGGGRDLERQVAAGLAGEVAGAPRLAVTQAGIDRVQHRGMADRGNEVPPDDGLSQQTKRQRIGRQDPFAPPDDDRGQRDRLEKLGQEGVAQHPLPRFRAVSDRRGTGACCAGSRARRP